MAGKPGAGVPAPALRVRAMERRRRLREALVAAAERMIRDRGLGGLKARDLARAAGCAVGAIYNIFPDLDSLILAVNAGTLDRIDAAVARAGRPSGPGGTEGATERLIALGEAYLAFAAQEPHLWRALTEHRLPPGTDIPAWYREQQARLFAHLDAPLAVLMPCASEAERRETARVVFSAVHGLVMLGLEEKLGALPVESLAAQLRRLVVTFCRGLVA